jgi:hypothetical protein
MATVASVVDYAASVWASHGSLEPAWVGNLLSQPQRIGTQAIMGIFQYVALSTGKAGNLGPSHVTPLSI